MNKRFNFVETPLDGLFLIERNAIKDSRGFFSRFFCVDEFKEIGLQKSIQQMNHTLTHKKGAIRGLHFQYPPHEEAKIVSCIQGEVLDVAVDIRKNSSTFLQWHAEILTAENQSSLYIPEGFAHGFQTLVDNCQLLYMHTATYAPNSEGALNALDPQLGIDWPVDITDISERDSGHPMLVDSQFEGVVVA